MNGDETAKLLVRVFDGRRKEIDGSVKLLITIRDGYQNQRFRDYYDGPLVEFLVPFFNNLGDNYTVIAWADDYKQAGFTPVKVSQAVQQAVDLMLLPRNGKIKFRDQDWAALKQNDPTLFDLLGHGAANDADAAGRYNELVDARPAALA